MLAPARSAPRILGADSGATAGQYVVGLKDDAWVTARGIPASARQLARAYQGHIKNIWQVAPHGFSVSMKASEALKLASNPNVAWVQQERQYHVNGTQEKPPVGNDVWGLDRLDERQGTNDRFHYATAGAGVHIYVLDTGIHANNNPDFTGRVTLGPNYVTSETPVHSTSDDCDGHGTAVAGLAAGTTYGVAKAAQVVAVRIFDCKGLAATEDPIINAINYVITNAIKPAVINLSLGSSCVDDGGQQPVPCAPGSFQAIVAAEQSAMQHGIPMVTAAGEALRPGTHPIDACGDPVGAAAGTINVGALSSFDSRATYSDFGDCVNIWAPGTNLRSDSFASPTGFSTNIGTSFAAPYVAGAAALLLGTGQFAGVPEAQLSAAVKAQILANSTPDLITGLPSSVPEHNAILYIPPTFEGTSVSLAKTKGGALQAVGTNTMPPGNMFSTNQTAPNAHTWNGWKQSANSGWLSTAADINADDRGQMLALTASGQIFQRQQIRAGDPAFTGWSQINGTLQSVAIARNENGVMTAVGINPQGVPFFSSQTKAGDPTWNPWTRLPALPSFTSVAAETDNDGIVQAFAVDTHGHIWTTAQTAANASTWTEFTQLTDPSNLFVSEVAAARDSTGKLNLIATDASDAMYQRSQAAGGSATWTVIRAGEAIMHLAAETNANGKVTLLTVDDKGSITQMDQTSLGSTIYDSFTVGGALRP